MTTKVRVENVEGNKAIKVLVQWENEGKALSDFTILSPTESSEFYVHDSQELHVREVGEFL